MLLGCNITCRRSRSSSWDRLSKNYICVREAHPLKKYFKQCDGTVF